MKTRYRFIHFTRTENPFSGIAILWEEREVWACRNNRSRDILGRVFWYSPWRQYVFEPKEGCVFNNTCLTDVQHFIGQLPTRKFQDADADRGAEA